MSDHPPEQTHPDGSRALAPHVWQSRDRRSGAPCVTGSRIDCETIYGLWRCGMEWPAIREEHFDITGPEYVAAVAFHAGYAYRQEVEGQERRRRAAKRKKGASE